MKRRKCEEKEKVHPVIWLILIIGAIIGAVVGANVVLNTTNIIWNILFCIATAGLGAIGALCIVHTVLSAIIEVRDAIEQKKTMY